VTAHRRALLFRAGAVAVLATGALFGIATPAFAAVTVDLSSASFDMNAGDTKNITVTLGGGPDTVTVTFTAPSANGNITLKTVPEGCNGAGGTISNCNGVVVPDTGTKNLTFQVQAKSPSTLQPGQDLNDQGGSVSASNGGENKSFRINLKAPTAVPTTAAATPTVTEVSGTVNDSTTGKTIKGAQVVMEDGAGKNRQTTSDDFGKYKFTGNAQNPIAPGTITVQAGSQGFENGQKQATGTAGKAVNVKVALVPLAPSASAEPLPTAGGVVVPESSTSNAGAAPQDTKTSNASNSSGGFSSWILIALGALLVVFGIVAIVLLLRRRGDDDDEDPDEEGPAPRRGGPGQRPGYRGAPQADPTMVGAMGGGTMVNRASDATAIVRPGRLNEFDVPADPYAAPPRTGYPPAPPANLGGAGGYGAQQPGGGYNDQAGYASGGYGGGGGAPGGGYGPASRPPVDPYGPEYGNGANGYDQGYGGGAGGGYSESTQRYEPGAGNYGASANGGYGASANGGYGDGPQAGGYGDRPQAGGYGSGGAPQSGGGYGAGSVGAGDGYGPPAGGYGAGGQGPSAGGYGPQAGGYPDGDGYGPSAGNGYGPSAGNGYNGGGGGADYDPPYAGRGADEAPYAGRGGYEPAAGYERDGYERVPEPPRAGNGYGPSAGGGGDYDQRGGYGPSAGGGGDYDQRGGYGPSANGGADGYDDGARPNSQRGGNRRSLDWLDD